MPLIDDLEMETSAEELGRRKFLGLAGSGAIATIAAGAGITTISYLSPRVLYEESTKFKVGRPEDIPVGHMVVLPRQKVYVMRTVAGIVALSAVCTHLGCVTRLEGGDIFCPCHGSHFSKDGKVTGGPAPRPLRRLAVTLERGQLVVDSGSFIGDEEVFAV